MTRLLYGTRQKWIDTLVALLAEFGVASEVKRETKMVEVGNCPREDSFSVSRTFCNLFAPDEVVTALKAAKKASPPNTMLPQEDVDAHVLRVYRVALERMQVTA